jgi:hypothetical protein
MNTSPSISQSLVFIELYGETQKEIDGSGMPSPSFTTFINGDAEDDDVFFDVVFVSSIFKDVEASYVRNLINLGSWNFPAYRGPRWCINLGRSSPVIEACES